MRKVDFWAGVPLATLVGLLLWVRDRIFSLPLPNVRERQRVLFIELSEMGSAILADPALRKVGRQHDVYFVIFKRNAVSLRLLDTVPAERIFSLRDTSLLALALDSIRFVGWCRQRKISVTVDLELFSRFTSLLAAISGATLRIGYDQLRGEGLYRGGIVNRGIAYNPHIHITKNFIALVDSLDSQDPDPYVKRPIEDHEVVIPDPAPDLKRQARVRELMADTWPASLKQSPLLIINANAGDLLPQRRWPPQHFVQLSKLIAQSFPEVRLGFTGSNSEKPFIDRLVSEVSLPQAKSIAGLFSFEELPSLYVQSTLIVTNDSGPAHFASACGLRTFVLFGPETPALYGPLKNTTSITAGLACSPCVSAANHRDTSCTDNQCMKQLSPATVFAYVAKDLRQRFPNMKSEANPETSRSVNPQ